MLRSLSIFLVLIVLLSACTPTTTLTDSSGQQPTPVEVFSTAIPTTPVSPTLDSVPGDGGQGYQPVSVDQVEAQVGVGSPIPVQVLVSGSLPDTCAQLEFSQQEQAGPNFWLTLSAIPSSADGCIQDTIPFRASFPLNVVGLPGGEYTVDVNGKQANFTLDTTGNEDLLPVDAPIVKEDVQIDAVEVEIGIGSPIPVHAIVSGNLPNTCSQLGEVRLHRDEATYYVRVIAYTMTKSECQADLLPFRLELPLNVINQPTGPATVNVNGTTASFDLGTGFSDDPTGFINTLKYALTKRDGDVMESLMSDDFILAHWQSEGVTYPADRAVVALLANYIGPMSALSFHTYPGLPGFDPQAMVGPDTPLASVIYVSGWGLDGEQDALLFVAQRENGSFYWHSVLVLPPGVVGG